MGTFSLRAAVKMFWYINSFSIKTTIPAMIGPFITRHYGNKIRERGKASENVHFRKIQYEQFQRIIENQRQIRDEIKKLGKELEDLKRNMEKGEENSTHKD